MPTRLLREGILDSEAVCALSFSAEVFYRRLMSVVDDFGRFDGRVSVLRSRLYPLQIDKVREADIPRWIAECEKAGLIALYSVSGKPYILFHKLGSPRAKESKYPAPPTNVTQPEVNHGPTPSDCIRLQTQTDENGCAQAFADAPYSGSGSGSGSGLFATASPPPEEVPAKPTRRPAKKPAAPRPRNPLFDAVAEVAGMDGSTAAAGSLIGSVAASLAGADPPYTAADVHTFASRFHELCPHAAKDRRPRPTPKEIEKYIGGIRAKPAPNPSATRPTVTYDPVPPMPTGKNAALPWHLKPKADDGEPQKEAEVEPADW